MAASMTLQVDDKLKLELESIARTTERSTDVVVTEALKAYVDHNSRQIAQIDARERSAGGRNGVR